MQALSLVHEIACCAGQRTHQHALDGAWLTPLLTTPTPDSAVQIDVLDIWTDYTPWPCNRLPKTYSFLVKYPFLWRLGFLTSQPRFVHVPVTTATAAFVGPQVSRAFDETRPDLVVSVHPLMQVCGRGGCQPRSSSLEQLKTPHAVMWSIAMVSIPQGPLLETEPLRLRQSARLRLPFPHLSPPHLSQIVPVRVLRQRIRNGLQKAINFATVVTDLTRCHNTWYYHRVDRCFVATEASKRQALDMGLKVRQSRWRRALVLRNGVLFLCNCHCHAISRTVCLVLEGSIRPFASQTFAPILHYLS